MIEFFVAGVPISQPGSRPFMAGGKAYVVTQSGKSKSWKQAIADIGARFEPISGPVYVEALFLFPRPKSLPRLTRQFHTKKPDGDKLLRPFFDALAKVLVDDDSYIVDFHIRKRYAKPVETPGVWVKIEPASEDLGIVLGRRKRKTG